MLRFSGKRWPEQFLNLSFLVLEEYLPSFSLPSQELHLPQQSSWPLKAPELREQSRKKVTKAEIKESF